MSQTCLCLRRTSFPELGRVLPPRKAQGPLLLSSSFICHLSLPIASLLPSGLLGLHAEGLARRIHRPGCAARGSGLAPGSVRPTLLAWLREGTGCRMPSHERHGGTSRPPRGSDRAAWLSTDASHPSVLLSHRPPCEQLPRLPRRFASGRLRLCWRGVQRPGWVREHALWWVPPLPLEQPGWSLYLHSPCLPALVPWAWPCLRGPAFLPSTPCPLRLTVLAWTGTT